MSAKKNTSSDPSTEQKIKDAARIVFHKKGYSATRTRDIAEEAGINLALLNYYFRSKEKLFNIIMEESFATLFQSMISTFNEPSTSWLEKIDISVEKYFAVLLEEPGLPLFILGEIQNTENNFMKSMQEKVDLKNFVFVKQLNEQIEKGNLNVSNPFQFILNLISLILFPFAAQNLFMCVSHLNPEQFQALLLERKKEIPKWIKTMMINNN